MRPLRDIEPLAPAASGDSRRAHTDAGPRQGSSPTADHITRRPRGGATRRPGVWPLWSCPTRATGGRIGPGGADGTERAEDRNGTLQDGTDRSSTVQDGTDRSSTVQDGTDRNSTVQDGTDRNARHGTEWHGTEPGGRKAERHDTERDRRRGGGGGGGGGGGTPGHANRLGTRGSTNGAAPQRRRTPQSPSGPQLRR
ncbi:hypothetical protein GCM10010429_17970 [Micromonospora olivasterospora]